MILSLGAALLVALISTPAKAATVEVSCFTDHNVHQVVRGTTDVSDLFWRQARVEVKGEFQLPDGKEAALNATFDLRHEAGQFMMVTADYQLWNPYLSERESFSFSSIIYHTFTVYQNRRVKDANRPDQVKAYSVHCGVETRGS